MAKKYFAGCYVGSTYTKAVILDEQGNIVAHTTIRSKINSEQSAQIAMQEVIDQVPDLHSSKDLEYLIGTGYGRNKVPFADENVSEISCHAMSPTRPSRPSSTSAARTSRASASTPTAPSRTLP